MKIEEMTTAQLEQALKERRKQEAERQKRARIKFRDKVLEHRDVLVELMTHDRQSCAATDNSGFHREHGGAYCNLCALKDLSEYDDDVTISVEVKLYRTSK